MNHIVMFHLPQEENGYLSNWYMRSFTVGHTTYSCVEQYMMEQKAILFHDYSTAGEIKKATAPDQMQKLGRQVQCFIQPVWDGMKQLIVLRGLLAKFEQNPDLCGRLMSTGTALLVECSKSDKVWGIGLGMYDQDVGDPLKWKGQNLLGFALDVARTMLTEKLLTKFQ